MNRDEALDLVRKRYRESARTMEALAGEPALFAVVAAEAIVAALRGGGRLFTCGNGGSAADAQHIAAELAGRFYRDRAGLAAVALTVNPSAVTAIGNDYGFVEVFARQLEGIAREGDVLVAITTSGSSGNVVRAVERARDLGLRVLGLTGAGGDRFAALCDHALVVPSRDTARIQEAHIATGHLVCELVERELFGEPA